MHNILEQIQPYDADRDEAATFDLWQKTVGQEWPVAPSRFRQILAGPESQHFVVREEEQVIGFCATLKSIRESQRVGHLAALLVAPHRQGRGIGTALHNSALKQFRGLSSVQLGSISPRFWCGVPGNLPSAARFFRARGWSFSETAYDLVQDLHHYITPPYIYQRMERERVSFEVASSQSIGDILAFETREFPNWLAYYKRYASIGDYQDLLVARDNSSGHIVGTLVMYSSQSHASRTDVIWQTMLGADSGAIGAVGVAASARGRGIGIALVARASDLLKERGVRNCYIDWVVLTDFYAKLGYTKWRDYLISWRTLD
jgi:GNAT superfamily N-acetyltransferase